MYPKLSDLINDLFGTDINLPIQSYGFFLAMAFLVGAWFLYKELQRKEADGLIIPQKKIIVKGKPASVFELITASIAGFVIGFKFLGFIFNYQEAVNEPQEFLFSAQGTFIGGFTGAIIYAAIIFYSKNKRKLDVPIVEEVPLHASELLWPIVFIALIFGVIGAKIFYWLEDWNSFISNPFESLLSFNGLTFYGGLITAAVVVGFFAERNGIKWPVLADAIAPSLILAYGIGRIGCQVAGDGDWGIVNLAEKPGWLSFLPDWLWAYNYPHNIINQGERIVDCTGLHCYQLLQPVFPTPIYESILALLIFGILWILRKKIKISGLLASIYLMFNGFERFIIEKIRINEKIDFLGMKLTQAEIISSLFFLAGILLFIYFSHKNKVKL
jgi:prolipoprotein diacylglyceryltransferase